MVRASVVVLLSFLSGWQLQAQILPIGPPFVVNSLTLGIQTDPDVVALNNGSFVVAWESDGSTGTDSSYSSIQVRRFSASGVPLAEQVQVNASTTGRQDNPRISADVEGRFVVAWDDDWSNFWDRARARLFTATGAPVGGEILLSSGGESGSPRVAMRPTGSFIATYQHGPFGPTWIDAHRFDAAGASLAPEFAVSSTPGDYEYGGAVSANEQGFVVVWSSGYPDHDVRARRFASDGSPLGAEFLVGSPGGSLYGEVALRADGSFVVAWQSATEDVVARQFGSDGAPTGSPIVVNSTPSTGHTPRLATDALGGFVIAWLDSSTLEIRARRFSATGVPLGPEFSPGAAGVAPPAVAAEPGGDFVLVWMNGAADIQGQRYQVRIFTGDAAGFENGTTCGWDAVVGGSPCP